MNNNNRPIEDPEFTEKVMNPTNALFDFWAEPRWSVELATHKPTLKVLETPKPITKEDLENLE